MHQNRLTPGPAHVLNQLDFELDIDKVDEFIQGW